MYSKIEKSIIRIKHIIAIKYDMKANELIRDLKKISDKAKLSDFNEEDQTITFEEEQVIEKR